MTFLPRSIMSRPSAPRELAIDRPLWLELLDGLRLRGNHERESGAFLLGPSAGPRTVTRLVFYDEIDPAAFDTGIIVIDGSRLAFLWRICRETGLRVVADVHTHPGEAFQSRSDRDHPMVAECGHVALIVPYFASEPIDLSEVGVYRYLGDFRWHTVVDGTDGPALSIGGE